MLTSKPGGFGAEHYGDPMGGGGPISVVRALAVDGRTVRVVFSEEPVFRTAAGLRDARNPANFRLTVVTGQATAPSPTIVLDDMVTGPARGVGNGGAADERGVDVAVDRALVQGITYRVTVQNVQARAGGELGAPYSADFPGVAPLAVRLTPGGRMLENIDVFNGQFASASWLADDSGDLKNETGLSGYRKRILRRATTPRNAYSFLRGYGVRIRLKELGSNALLAQYKADLEQQVLAEPETASVQVSASVTAAGLTTVLIDAKTKTGALLRVGFQASPAGQIVL